MIFNNLSGKNKVIYDIFTKSKKNELTPEFVLFSKSTVRLTAFYLYSRTYLFSKL